MRSKLVIIGVALVFVMVAYAYVGTRDRSIDVEDPALISQQQEDGLICCMLTYEHDGEQFLLVVTRELEGEFRRVVFRVMEFDDDGAPREINAIGSPFDGVLPTRFSVVDQTAYVPLDGSGGAGIWTVDVSDPAWPEDAGFTETGEGPTRQLAARGDVLAINHTDEIAVLDISDRYQAEIISRFEQPVSGVVTMKMVDSWLIINDAVNDEFRIYDLTAPRSPEMLLSHRNPDGPGELEFDFGTADAEDRLNQTAIPSRYLDYAVSGDIVYLAASDLGLRLLDISDPESPVILGEMELPDRAVRVELQGDRLFVLGASTGNVEQLTYSIHALDISEPLDPALVDTINGILSEPGIQVLTVEEERLFLGLYESILVFDAGD